MFLLWMMGALFTDRLCDLNNEQRCLDAIVRFFIWPYELGQFIAARF